MKRLKHLSKENYFMDTNELKQYLKDVYELESQLFNLYRLKFTLEDLHKEYQEQKDQELTGNETYLGYDEEYIFEQDDILKCHGIESLCDYVDFEENDTWYISSTVNQLPKKWQSNPNYNKLSRECEAKSNEYKTYSNGLKTIRKIAYIAGIILAFVLCHFDIVKSIIFSVIACVVITIFLPKEPQKSSKFKDYKEVETKLGDLLANFYQEDLEQKVKWNNERCVYVSDKYKNVIIPAINETEETLKTLYSKNIIHEKYRNFPTVAQLYEYMDTGRCTELEGAHGAYNLYESELRQNIIINKLDDIIAQLEQLNSTMSYMASAIGQSNALLSSVCNSLDSIQTNTAITASNSAITAYNTQCTAYNSALLRRYS